MRQLATKLRSRPQGKFPTNTKNPKREKEQCQDIKLRSSKTLDKNSSSKKSQLSEKLRGARRKM